MIKRHIENPIKYSRNLLDKRIKCTCGHSIYIPARLDKVICGWCNNYVFKDKKIEFEYRMKERMNNNGN